MNIDNLKKKYSQAAQEGKLGGADLLDDLADEVLKVVKSAPSKHVVALFVLFKIFHDISRDQEGRKVALKEAKQIYNKLDKGIKKLLRNIEENKNQEILLNDTAHLIKSYYHF